MSRRPLTAADCPGHFAPRPRRLRQAGIAAAARAPVRRQGQGRVRGRAEAGRPARRRGRRPAPRRRARARGRPADRQRAADHPRHQGSGPEPSARQLAPMPGSGNEPVGRAGFGETAELMNHFEPGAASSSAKTCRLAEIAAVGRHAGLCLFRPPPSTRHYKAFDDAFQGKALIAYRGEGQLQPVGPADVLAKLGCRRRHGVGRRDPPRAWPPACRRERIVFSGVGKTDHELAFALDVGVAEINVEAEPELDRLVEVAAEQGVRAPHRHSGEPRRRRPAATPRSPPARPRTSSASRCRGRAALRQGLEPHPALEPLGVACHIGSQITDLAPMREAASSRCASWSSGLRGQGLRREPPRPRRRPRGALFQHARSAASDRRSRPWCDSVAEGLDVELAFEPGRVIAANAGVLVSRVIHVHERPEGRRFLVVDAAMNDLIRPAMYDAYPRHPPGEGPAATPPAARATTWSARCARPATPSPAPATPPSLAPGDLVAFMSAGAYGAVMSSEYNTRPLVPEVLVDGDRWARGPHAPDL